MGHFLACEKFGVCPNGQALPAPPDRSMLVLAPTPSVDGPAGDGTRYLASAVGIRKAGHWLSLLTRGSSPVVPLGESLPGLLATTS